MIKKKYVDIDKKIKMIRNLLSDLNEDLKEIDKLGKDYKNLELMKDEMFDINIILNDMETINKWSFKDKELNWK
jgi:hypothetical protein